MDPISVTASVIAVATLAAQIAAALSDLRTLCKQLPGRLHALSNEVSDVEVVLIQVAKVIEERSCSPIATAETDYFVYDYTTTFKKGRRKAQGTESYY
jgi:enamine deaminase RidA (YjgF/YER057c/UK114 family)